MESSVFTYGDGQGCLHLFICPLTYSPIDTSINYYFKNLIEELLCRFFLGAEEVSQTKPT